MGAWANPEEAWEAGLDFKRKRRHISNVSPFYRIGYAAFGESCILRHLLLIGKICFFTVRTKKIFLVKPIIIGVPSKFAGIGVIGD